MKYFAYGANLDRDHMRRTAPLAVALGGAYLADHRVAIGHAGFGTLVSEPGGIVYGLLWELSAEGEDALDRFERVADGMYRKEQRRVVWADGPVSAMVYLAADEREGAAHPDYVRWIVGAASGAGLPADYVAALEQLPQDPSASALP